VAVSRASQAVWLMAERPSAEDQTLWSQVLTAGAEAME
jgi:hypothetical protein